MSLELRRASLSDTEHLVDARLKFLEASGMHGDKAMLGEDLLRYFNRELATGKCIAFFASMDGQPAGCGMLSIREQPGNFKNPSGRFGYILNMHTFPRFRKQGVCTAILDALKQEARKAGVDAFELLSTAEGEPVYRKNGFSLHPQPTYRQYPTDEHPG